MIQLNRQIAETIAHEWIDAWNSHELPRILSHYTEDFEMSSPFIVKILPDANRTLKGKGNVGDYWQKALNKYSDLHFEFIDVFFSVDTICIQYTSVLNLKAIEWLHLVEIDEEGKYFLVDKASGSYNDFPK
jgi:ketosteroid isomerase-like protein